MNLSILKSVGFWVAAAAAICGVLVSQHVVVDGSLASDIIGWALTLLGAGGAGHKVATANAAQLDA